MKRSREPEEEYPQDNTGLSDGLRLEEVPQPATKITELDESAVDTSLEIAMRCSLPPHREVLSFTTYGDYEAHYKGCDRKCRTPYKRRNHLIDKHMYPKNYFFALTKDGIDGRQSLLLDEGHRRRRSSTATISQRRQSLRQAEAPKPHGDEQTEVAPVGSRGSVEIASPPEIPEVEMNDLTAAMSALQFIPTSVKFGRGRGKAGFAKR
ncbi:hypothetical protein CHU98_g5791 [Xylaria longipes]|nr:hypothetical protein CHU98_g5791 [Xylaria longipes]